MLRLIGVIIVILLIIGPILVQVGLVPPGGLIHQFVDLETRIVVDAVNAVRSLWDRTADLSKT
jgi:hypothetical protein